jgi:hypothetical protein
MSITIGGRVREKSNSPSKAPLNLKRYLANAYPARNEKNKAKRVVADATIALFSNPIR